MPVTLIERQTDFGREFRGEQIPAKGTAALKAMGLYEAAVQGDHLPQGLTDVYFDRKLKFQMLVGEEVLYLPQPPFLEMVIKRTSEFPNFTFLRKHTLTGLIEEGDRVTGIIVKTPEGTKVELRADVIIGADGRFSKLRSLVGMEPDQSQPSESFDLVWCRLPGPASQSPHDPAKLFVGDRTLTFAFPCPNDDIQLGWIIDKGSFSRHKLADGGWLSGLKAELPDELASHLETHRDAINHSLLNVVCYAIPKWSQRGVLLIGDAAHPMSPAGGQGITASFRDAIITANQLAGVLAKGADRAEIDRAFDRIQSVRMPEILSLQAQQRRMSATLLQRTWLSRFLVRHALPIAGRALAGVLSRSIVSREMNEINDDVSLDPRLFG